MTPLIESRPPPNGLFKFVRGGGKIGYEDIQLDHEEIAAKFGIGVQVVQKRGNPKIVVDDAGYMTVEAVRIILDEHTSTCEIRGDWDEARDETARIITSATGLPVKQGW
jgi:hypothetical protein